MEITHFVCSVRKKYTRTEQTSDAHKYNITVHKMCEQKID